MTTAETQSSEDLDLDQLCREMGAALYLIRVATAAVPDDTISLRGYTRHRAVVMGHMVRLGKILDAFYYHFAKNQNEICGILSRLIFETEIRLSYLIKFGLRKATKTYILAFYRAEKTCLVDLKEKSRMRPLTPIEKRIKRKIMQSLQEDGITLKELLANKVWDIDGKPVKAMLKALGREWEYGYSFAMQSSWVHGNWHELKSSHLERRGRHYLPSMESRSADIRIGAPVFLRCLEVTQKYLAWSKADPDRIIRKAVKEVLVRISEIDARDEERVSQRADI